MLSDTAPVKEEGSTMGLDAYSGRFRPVLLIFHQVVETVGAAVGADGEEGLGC